VIEVQGVAHYCIAQTTFYRFRLMIVLAVQPNEIAFVIRAHFIGKTAVKK
jgi:hypothetical protein